VPHKNVDVMKEAIKIINKMLLVDIQSLKLLMKKWLMLKQIWQKVSSPPYTNVGECGTC